MKNTNAIEKDYDLIISEATIHKYNSLMSVKSLDYEHNDMPRYETIASWTVDFGDGYEIDLKVCSSDDGDPLWCEAVLFKDGCERSCTDVEEVLNGDWNLNADGISFNLHVKVA